MNLGVFLYVLCFINYSNICIQFQERVVLMCDICVLVSLQSVGGIGGIRGFCQIVAFGFRFACFLRMVEFFGLQFDFGFLVIIGKIIFWGRLQFLVCLEKGKFGEGVKVLNSFMGFFFLGFFWVSLCCLFRVYFLSI